MRLSMDWVRIRCGWARRGFRRPVCQLPPSTCSLRSRTPSIIAWVSGDGVDLPLSLETLGEVVIGGQRLGAVPSAVQQVDQSTEPPLIERRERDGPAGPPHGTPPVAFRLRSVGEGPRGVGSELRQRSSLSVDPIRKLRRPRKVESLEQLAAVEVQCLLGPSCLQSPPEFEGVTRQRARLQPHP